MEQSRQGRVQLRVLGHVPLIGSVGGVLWGPQAKSW